MLRRIQRTVQSPLLRTVLRDGSDTDLHEAGGQGGEPNRRSGVATDEVNKTLRTRLSQRHQKLVLDTE